MPTEILNLGGVRDRGHQCILDIWWKDQRLDWDSNNNIEYIGTHNLQDAATTDSDWVIKKFSYDASYNITRIEVLTGSWDGRAALGWGA